MKIFALWKWGRAAAIELLGVALVAWIWTGGPATARPSDDVPTAQAGPAQVTAHALRNSAQMWQRLFQLPPQEERIEFSRVRLEGASQALGRAMGLDRAAATRGR